MLDWKVIAIGTCCTLTPLQVWDIIKDYADAKIRHAVHAAHKKAAMISRKTYEGEW
jgi:hypothetical protein